MTYPVFSGGIDDTFAPVYPVARSVRFRANNSARFTRTFVTPTTQGLSTWSAWVKRGTLGAAQGVFAASINNQNYLGFTAGDALQLILGGTTMAATTALFRDPAAWYHIVYRRSAGGVHTIYVNGVSVGTVTLVNTVFNSAVSHAIGASATGAGANYFDGLMAYVYFVDGQALTPSSFGAYNSITGVWQPIKYTGTFGNNGAFLTFQDNSSAANLGLDSSGNGNDWAPLGTVSVTAGVTYDSMLDVPTPTSTIQCNYPAINSLSKINTASVTGGGLQTTSVASQVLLTTMRMDTGKFYWEITFSAATSNQIVGVYKTSATVVTLTTGLTTTAIGVRFDANAGTLDYTTDGTTYISISTGLTGGGYFPYASNTLGTKIIYVNFGQRPFTWNIPTDYGRLNSFELAAPVPNSRKAFAVSLYTGNGTSQSITNTRDGGSFYPDIVWLKGKSTATNNVIYDSVRGGSRELILTTTAVQSTTSGVTAFNSNGFTVGSAATANSNTFTYNAFQWNAGSGTSTWNFNGSLTRTATMTIASPCVVTLATNGFTAGQAVQFTTTGALPTGVTAGVTYYAGNILTNTTFNLYDTEANAITGGATGRVDTSGTQSGTHTCEHASLISVNPTTGTSIVRYVGVGANTTVGHGLNAVPEFMFFKNTTVISSWPSYHVSIGNGNYMYINGSAVAAATTTLWNSTTPTSSVFSLGTNGEVNTNGVTYMGYCFAPVPGYSAFGLYAGDGLTNGIFTYTGFAPRFLILKRSSTTASSWINFNNSAQDYNVMGPYYFIDNSAAQAAVTTLVDIVSNGFKQRSSNAATNASGFNYVYMAWADSPFKYSLAR